MKNFKKFLLAVICVVLIVCTFSTMQVFATTYITDKTAAIGSHYTSNLSLARALDVVFNGDVDIYSDSSFKNEVSLPIGKKMVTSSNYYIKSHTTGNSCIGKQCYIYANAVYNKLFNEWVGHGTSLSHSEVVVTGGRNTVSYSLFSSAKVKCGAYMRTTNYSSGEYNGNAGHSLIILSYNTEYITYLEGNADGQGLVRITKQTWSEFNAGELSGRSRYVSHIVQPLQAKYNELYSFSYVNLGNDFYARIKHPTSGNYLCNVNSNVELGTGGTKASKWRFIRQTDGSYKIYSCVNNGLIDVANAATANGTNIQVCSGDSGSDAQKWYIVNNGQYYNFVTPLCGKALDLANAKTAVGTNVQLCNLNGNSAQLFTVVKICSTHAYSSKVTKAATCTEPGARKYVCSTCSESYTEEIPATGHSYDSGKVTKKATCKAVGVKTYACTTCGGTKTKAIAKLTKHTYSNNCDTECNVCSATRNITHTYKTFTTKATLSKNGKTEKKCSVCGNATSTKTIKYVKSVKLSATSYTYNGKAKTPSVAVEDSAGKALKKGTDYTVTYAKDRKNVGTYKVTVKLIGKYTGTKVLTFKIVPAKTAISKLTAAKKSFSVTLKKVSQVTGYQIQYSTSSSFSGAKTVTLSATKLTVKNLSAKKKYYVRVRTYKLVDGTKYYSAWSAAKSVKTK